MYQAPTLTYKETLEVLQQKQCLLSPASNLPASAKRARIIIDSRQVEAGDIFIAYQGASRDSHDFLSDVFKKKPGIVIVEKPVFLSIPEVSCLLTVTCGREAWAWLCAKAYGNPQENLKLFGVTGTNGKTSSVGMLAALLGSHKLPWMSIGTLGIYTQESFTPTNHTTPDPPQLFANLKDFVDKGGRHVLMEVSSHSVVQKKLVPLKFEALAWTSFSQDHLDFHNDMASYWQAKWQAFQSYLKPNGRAIFAAHLAPFPPLNELPNADCWVYGNANALKSSFAKANLLSTEISSREATGSFITLMHPEKRHQGLIPYLGLYNGENFACAFLLAEKALGYCPEPPSWHKLAQIPGRLERVTATANALDKPTVIVDYAHTPDALEKALQTLRPFCQGKLWLVFGCGGDRDKRKRPLMAAVAERLADKIIVTSDNPRSEQPQDIIADIKKGFAQLSAVTLEADRERAIKLAVHSAKKDDLVLIAGKGHETYQIIGEQTLAFDDRQMARKFL